MQKIKIFISSVQSEFIEERQMLFDYLTQDALLGIFFDPFLFEKIPAIAQSAEIQYLSEVKKTDIYLGIFGEEYGSENEAGISPTEKEFDLATKLNKTRLIYIANSANRNVKEIALIKKAENDIIRKKFNDKYQLKTAVYASLVKYLEEQEFIRSGPFDSSICRDASFDDIDNKRVIKWIRAARFKRGFPMKEDTPVKDVFAHLDLIKNDKLTNAALLLFGSKPQRFFISSEVKCAHFHGYEVAKPIPSYQVYKGDVFQLVDAAVDFVLSKINIATGVRDKSAQVDVTYEIPIAVITEAIVNAVVHRDYSSNGSVQVMLFKDRFEVWSPGRLPSIITLADLRTVHSSYPINPLLAEAMYLAGYIERMGTGTCDMIKLCEDNGLKTPTFCEEDSFRISIKREILEENIIDNLITRPESGQVTGQVTRQVTRQETRQETRQVTGQVKESESRPESGQETRQETRHETRQVTGQVKKIVLAIKGNMSRKEIQDKLKLKARENFEQNYLKPSIYLDFIEMTIPEKPNSRLQKYRITDKGEKLLEELK